MLKRRDFLEAGVVTGASLLLASSPDGGHAAVASDTLNVALIGAGVHGRALMQAALLIPGIRFAAVCDIWRYSRNAARNYLSTYKQEAADYADYREMLQKEKGLHAAIVATPDFLHAEQTSACLKAGLHVYCEKPMSNSLDAARSMVRTAKEAGKLLQIGYQRRSNPRYRHVEEVLLKKVKLPGRLTHVSGQWNHGVKDDVGWPKKFAMRDAELKRYGYEDMHAFRNWRAYKKFSGGRFADFGAQQVDAVNWFLGSMPTSVLAGGGIDYYKTHEWPDTVMAILQYETAEGTVRALLSVQTTTGGGGEMTFEHFMGTEGSIKISENPKWTKVFREPHAKSWDDLVRQGYLASKEDVAVKKPATSEDEHVRETGVVVPYELPIVLNKPLHQPHLENFFDAVRGKAKLTCPAEEAFRTEVVIHKVNEAIDAKKMVLFTPDEFKA
jgi:predicted dehydrogenase